MKTLVVSWALVVALLLGPVLARPNLVEPIYLRRRSNPLEIIEESVEAGSAANGSSGADQSTEQQAPASAETTQQQKGATAASDATTGTTGSSPSTTHQPSYAYKRPSELLKTKIGTSGFVVSTSTKVLTGGGDRTPSSSASLSVKSGEAKANDQLTLSFQDRFTGHAGVAEPLTDEEYQNELHRATERVPVRTTTPREGLSTWVLLSGSDSTEQKAESTSTTTRKVQIMHTTTTKPVAMGSTTKRYQTPTMRRNLPTTTQRPVKTTTSVVEEKKEKPSKPIPKQKVVTTTLKPVIVKKVKKPPTTTTTTAATTTSTTTTTTPAPKPTPTTSTTTTSTSTTTELVLTEQSASTVANDLPAKNDAAGPQVDSESDSSVETSTFLIMEPKDAMFDLPEDRSPSKVAPAATKTKKVTRKPNVKSPAAGGASGTKKKPANKKNRKPEVKDGVTKAPNKNGATKPVSTQIINYLSREVMPTVGVGLVGLVMAAGLASYFLGSPLGALRRSDDRKDDLYYSNYEEYAGPDGQNEEDVFGKLIAGMPDRSYYRNNGGNVRRRIQQQQPVQQQQAPVRTGHQYYHVQPYTGNKYPHITYRNRAYGGASAPDMYSNINRQAQVQPKSQNLAPEFHYTPPTPYYPARMSPVASDSMATVRPAAPVYSASVTQAPVPSTTTTTTTTTPMPATERPLQDAETEHEMMPHPEAYSSEHSPEHHAHYVVGGAGSSYADSMLDMINSASMPEHGPRKKRAAASVAPVMSASSEEAEFDNEIDVDGDDDGGDEEFNKNIEETDPDLYTITPMRTSTTTTTTTTMDPETTNTTEVHRYTWGDFIRNTVERKVKLGLNFLQHVTMDFQRYLNGVQEHLVQHSSSSSTTTTTEPAEH